VIESPPKLKALAIHCMDCTQSPINGEARLVFADPPYNIGVDYGDSYCDKEPAEHYAFRLQVWAQHSYRIARPDGVVAFLNDARNYTVQDGSLDYTGNEHKWVSPKYRRTIVWHERFAQYQEGDWTADYRVLFLRSMANRPGVWNPDPIRVKSVRQEMGDKRANPKGRVPGSVWQVRRLQGTAKDRVPWHPAQLPPEPLERLVLAYTNPGDLVVDMFAGSGSMAMVCKRLGRRFAGYDTNAEYVRRANERLAQ
jgi:DNA modification methylase